MLIDNFPEVQALTPADKWQLIDELWRNLAQQITGAAPNQQIIDLLENRFNDYLADPSLARPEAEVFDRLAYRKSQWK